MIHKRYQQRLAAAAGREVFEGSEDLADYTRCEGAHGAHGQSRHTQTLQIRPKGEWRGFNKGKDIYIYLYIYIYIYSIYI